MYAIIQELNGYTSVVGKDNRIYDDLNEAIRAWLDTSIEWHKVYAKECLLHTKDDFPSWTDNPPKLIDLSNKSIIHPSRDMRRDYVELYKKNKEMILKQESDFQTEVDRINSEHNKIVKALLLKP